jgi:RsiW-degrading membrane proteinase PrsW (M82 family)
MAERDTRTVVKYVLGALALVAMLVLAPFFIASGLMAPGWAVAVFIAIWVVLFGLGCVWIRRRPLWVIPLPFVAAAILLGGMSAGGEWLGWTA